MTAFQLPGVLLGTSATRGGIAGTYLPTTSLLMARGMKRMVAGYSGPLFRLTRTGGAGGTLDVSCATGTDYPNWAAVKTAWSDGWTSLAIQRYDQSAAAAGLETLAASGIYLDWQPTDSTPERMWGSIAPAICRGGRWSMPLAGTRNNMSVIQAVEIRSPMETNGGLWTTNDSGSGFCAGLYTNNQISPAYFNGANLDIASANRGPFVPRANPSVIGFTSSGTERRLYVRGNSVSAASETSLTTATFIEPFLGSTLNWTSSLRHFGTAVYSALNDTDMQAAITAMNQTMNFTTTFAKRLVIQGDSISCSLQATYLNSIARGIYVAYPDLEVFCVGQSSQTMATELTNRASITDPLFTSSYGAGNCGLIIMSGTNDIGLSGATDSTLYTTATSFVTAEKAVGFKVALADIFPRTDASWTGTMEGYRFSNASPNNYQARVLANAAGADVTIDLSNTGTTMGALTAPNNTALYADKLHPQDGGYDAACSASFVPAVRTLLGYP